MLRCDIILTLSLRLLKCRFNTLLSVLSIRDLLVHMVYHRLWVTRKLTALSQLGV